MKKFHTGFIFTALLFSYVNIIAQNTVIPVRFTAGDFITGNNIQQQSFQTADLQPALFNNDYYVLVQFAALPSEQVRKNLKNAGLDLGTYFPGNAYLATIKKDFNFPQAAQYGIISNNRLPAF
jgi:hypothetical protein